MFDISGENLTDIYLTRGDTASLQVNLCDGGNVYNLQPGDKLTMTVRKTIDSSKAFSIVANEDGVLSIVHNDTAALDYGVYVYDIQLTTTDGGIYTVIPVSTFEVGQEVTR